MSETVKLIIELPKDYYEIIKHDVEHNLTHFRTEEIIGNGIPLDDVKAEINEERVFARDDFRQYKVDILGVDPETVDDEYPNDEFHKGMERVIDIIDNIGKGDKE